MECTFDRIRDVVASRLWQLLVVESRLLEHLTTLKRNYLLALLPDAVESTAEVHVVYEVKSPLHLVISPTSLQRYDELFQFMLRLKRVSNALQERSVRAATPAACVHSALVFGGLQGSSCRPPRGRCIFVTVFATVLATLGCCGAVGVP